jgi:hypothetical protein
MQLYFSLLLTIFTRTDHQNIFVNIFQDLVDIFTGSFGGLREILQARRRQLVIVPKVKLRPTTLNIRCFC